jgi:hypothetical protein
LGQQHHPECEQGGPSRGHPKQTPPGPGRADCAPASDRIAPDPITTKTPPSGRHRYRHSASTPSSQKNTVPGVSNCTKRATDDLLRASIHRRGIDHTAAMLQKGPHDCRACGPQLRGRPNTEGDPCPHTNDGKGVTRTRDHLLKRHFRGKVPGNESGPCSEVSCANRSQKSAQTPALPRPMSHNDLPIVASVAAHPCGTDPAPRSFPDTHNIQATKGTNCATRQFLGHERVIDFGMPNRRRTPQRLRLMYPEPETRSKSPNPED